MACRPVASLRTREYDALRAVLRELREEKGLSQETLSKRLRRPTTYIGKIETGTRRLDLIKLPELAEALGTDLLSVATVPVATVDSQKA